ncbi:MAG: DUF11 domain-containing protein, partial [Bacteroides sp.]|nr:DUF11 domain-containing protein [Bacteroides sp.]
MNIKNLYNIVQAKNAKSILLSVIAGIAGIMMICNTASAQTDPTLYSPDTDFTIGTDSGLNGFDGTQISNGTEDFVCPLPSGDCADGDLVSVSMVLTAATCPGEYSTATLTFSNLTGIALSGMLLEIDITGTDAVYSGEPYNLSSGLQMAQPNILDAAYPNVDHAIDGNSGKDTLELYNLPAGSSTLDLDIILGSTQTDLTFTLLQIPTAFNASGDATTTDNIDPGAVPSITGTCPSDVDFTETTLTLNYSTMNASSVKWTSGSNGSFADSLSANTTYTINDIDRANGYVDLSLQALSVDGCDNSISCLVNITGASFDYGDAPATYDLNEDAIPVAAAATLSSNVFIGSIAPDTEGTNQPSASADGDGAEDDGIANLFYPYLSASEVYTIDVTATNNSSDSAYLYVFMDLNTDGDFLGDEGEKSAEVTVLPGSGTNTYQVSFTIPAGASLTEDSTYVRVRIGTEEFGSSTSYGSTPNGEVEDFQFKLDPENDLSLTKTVSPSSVEIGSDVVYTIVVSNAGPFEATNVIVSDTLPTSFTYVSDDGGVASSHNSGVLTWSAGTIAIGGSATLNITVTANAAGIPVNSAEVTASDLNDPDSTPNNNNPAEDYQDSICVSIVVPFCTGDPYTLTAQ